MFDSTRFCRRMIVVLWLSAMAMGCESNQRPALAPSNFAIDSAFTGSDSMSKHARGYLTTPQELRIIGLKAAQGIDPYTFAYRNLVRLANQEWLWEQLAGRVTCPAANDPGYIMGGGRLVYAKALAYHLTGIPQYANDAITAIQGLLQITSFGEPGDSDFPDRQCQLNLSWAIPGFIRAADLLEGNAAWQASGLKPVFQEWLARVVYPTISFAAENSVSNWGAAATNTSTYIADYLWDRPELLLVSYNRLDTAIRTTARTPAEAYEHAIQLALGRMNGERAQGPEGSSESCDRNSETKSMIRPDGGIPDELRRGSSGCAADRIAEDDNSNMYSQTHLQNLIAQAELLLRRGDKRIYDNIQNEIQELTYQDPAGETHTVTLPAGRGSLRQAILFVLDAPSFQRPRALRAAGEVAYRYYRHPAMLNAVMASRPNSGDRAMSFETLTHGFNESEDPAPPPTVAPPL